MKKILSFLIIGLSLAACTDKLDLSPVSTKNVDGFYKTKAQFNQAIIGCYDGLQNAVLKQDYSYMLTESRSDNAWQQVDYDDGQTSRFIENSETQVLNTAWAASYQYIARCNYVLKNLEGSTVLSEELKNQYKGEALFIRALIYFDLVRYFGEVPIVDKVITIEEGYSIKKSTTEEVYDFIVNDLKEASELLPAVKPSQNENRATATAARAFLGKVYVFRCGYPLNKDEWDLAATELKAALDNVGKTGFFANYSDIFLYSNEGKDQAIFSIGCKSGAEGEGNPFPTRNTPNGIYPGNDPLMIPYGGSPMQLFLDSYILGSIFDEPNDLRYKYSVQTEWIEKSKDTIRNWPFCSKYKNGPVAAAYDWDIDYILLRYTDVYMLYAEAQYHNGYPGEALGIINDVRRRAGLTELNLSDIDSDSKFVDVILRERRKEFCFENQRWFDLVRTDRAFDVMKAFLKHYGADGNLTSKDQYFYPIPQRETDVTGLTK
ncbi:MAG TPA: RagB/SusD family nutrient uptake outer membrane protein [Bacteroidales bacterium]|nr:RagB/SusD family nutrient uptake outer membrane protein [Bacteroidales bacterium]